jgi:hypothetical protein
MRDVGTLLDVSGLARAGVEVASCTGELPG